MTCRIARASPCQLHVNAALCCACGSANLEMCATSRILGPHLCESCARSMGDRRVKVDIPVSRVAASITPSSGSRGISPYSPQHKFMKNESERMTGSSGA